ncbi:hypothetical protein NIES2101_10845 [Calothrix sp. HK-06]|nr:hypothetical protein NIES2101_10845 [Calothrix sp. HK-06]
MAKKQFGFFLVLPVFLLCALRGKPHYSLARRRKWWSGVKNLIFGLILVFILHTLPFKSVQALPPSTYSLSVLIQQGKELFQASRFTEAITIWQQGLNQEKAQGNQLTQAMLLNHLSLAYQELGQWQQAEAAITSSLKLIQSNRNSNNHVSTKLIFAQALNTQGSLQLAQGKTEQALHTWQQATGAYTEAGSISGKIGANLNQAQAQQALGMYLQARKTLKELEQTLLNQPDQELKITGLRSLGNVLRLVGDLNDSRRVLQQITKIQNVNTTFKQHLSLTFLSLGNTARAQGDTEAALIYYQQAIVTSSGGIKQLQAEINKLSLLIETKQQSEAEILSKQILSKLTDLPTSRVAVYAAINFSQNLVKLGDGNKKASAQILAKAIQQAKNLGDQRAESYALGYLGGLYEKNQQWSQAQDLTQQALQIAQSINASDITYQWQWQLGRILKARGEVEQATGAYKVAFTTLKSLRSDLVAINPDIQFSFRESVEPLYREYVEMLLSEGNSGEIEPSQENLTQARVVIESLQLAELDNFFRSACLQGQIVSVEQIERSQAAVIYPIILKDKLEVIVSLQGRLLSHYSTNVSQSQVEETLEELRLSLEKPYTAPEGKSLAQTVYSWLISPIDTELLQKQIKTLVFVLDGGLRNVPMAALYDGKQYLVEKYSIALTPGLELLGPKPLNRGKLKTLVAGLTEARHGFSSLPNVNDEVEAIKSEIPSEVLLNQTFTSSALRKEVDTLPFSVVHLATHGQFSSNADKTFVLAWDRPVKVNELKELLRGREEIQPEPIELLVLSACETAEGDKRAALGLAGIAVRSGARSTLASLWSLDDASGARLISRFYRELAKKNITKAEALRQAQLSLLQDPDYRHPIHWAPYVLLGNWL